MADVNIWTAVAAVAGPSVTALGGWWVARRKGRTEAVDAQAAMIKAAQEAATEMVTTLRGEIAALREDAMEDRKRIAELERDLAAEKRARANERHELASRATTAEARAMLAEKAAAEAVGERRQLEQRIDSLTRRLQAAGIEVPDAPTRMTEPALLGEPA